MFTMGYKRPIIEEDIYEPLNSHKSEIIVHQFTQKWDQELGSGSPSTLRLFYNMYGLKTLLFGVLHSITDIVIDCVQPQILGALIMSFVDDKGSSVITSEAYLYAAGIVLCSFLYAATTHPFIYYIFETAMKLRIGSTGLVYKKVWP